MRAYWVPWLIAAYTACSTAEGSKPSGQDAGGSGGGAGSGGSIAGGSGGGAGSGGSIAGAGGSIDSGADGNMGDCQGLDETACVAAQQKGSCTAYFGSKVPGGAQQFVVCSDYCVGGAVLSCSVDPSGTCWKFPDTCTPTGWTHVFECSLNAPPACSGALDAG